MNGTPCRGATHPPQTHLVHDACAGRFEGEGPVVGTGIGLRDGLDNLVCRDDDNEVLCAG